MPVKPFLSSFFMHRTYSEKVASCNICEKAPQLLKLKHKHCCRSIAAGKGEGAAVEAHDLSG